MGETSGDTNQGPQAVAGHPDSTVASSSRKRKATDQSGGDDSEIVGGLTTLSEEDILEEIAEEEEDAYGEVWEWSELWEEAGDVSQLYDSRTGEVLDSKANEKARALELFCGSAASPI